MSLDEAFDSRTELAGASKPGGPELERGASIGKYLVLEKLGSGGMGVVYKAYDPELDRQIALKLLRADKGEAAALSRDRLLREAQALARLSHPNVVAVHEIGAFEEHVFLAMELAEGQTLRAWLKEKPRTRREILAAYLAAGEGLAAAHRAGLVHRDFKPDNAIISSDGRVRVLDFGLVRAAGEAPPQAEGARSQTGETGALDPELRSSITLDERPGGRTVPHAPPVEAEAEPEPNAPEPKESDELTPGSGPAQTPESGGARLTSISSSRRSKVLHTQLTHTGSIMGTPRYMAPEQHRGLPADERADQFSFCLSLYEALYGVDPFKASSAAQDRVEVVLAGRVGPPPQGTDVPARLRAILLRGLSAPAQARWPSMEALLAELRRDPRARLRKAALILAATLALAAALVGSAAAIHARRLAHEQARLAHEFGQEEAQISAAARIAALLPLHDLRPEREEIRARMAAIESHMRALGAVATGPGHYALGRGYVALDKWEEAARELEAAWAAGYRSPDLSYSLGLAHGKLYQKALGDLVKTDDAAADARKKAAIERAHKEPAIRHLTDASVAGTSRAVGTPEVAQGLIALYEDRYEDALALARRAQAKAPSLFEAHTLEGDIYMAMAFDRTWRGDDRGNEEALLQAGPAFGAAIEIGRSSVPALGGECRRSVGLAAAALEREKLLEPQVKAALGACEQARKARPDAAWLLAVEARAWNLLAIHQAAHGIDPTPAFEETRKLDEAALALDPKEVSALLGLANAYLNLGDFQFLRGLDARPAITQATALARRALAVDPTDFPIYTTLADALGTQAKDEIKRGIDPRATFAEEADCARQQRRYFPRSVVAFNTLQSAWLGLAHWQRDHGLRPESALEQGLSACDEEIAVSPASATAQINLCYGEWVFATYLALIGQDPRAHVERGIASCQRALEITPNDWIAYLDVGVNASALARWQVDRGEDPQAALGQARAALGRALAIDPNHLNYRYLAELELIEARAQMARGKHPERALQAAEAAARKVLAVDGNNPDVLRALADLERRRGEWQVAHGESPAQALREGLAAAERAARLDPQTAASFALEGALHLVAARAARSPVARSDAAQRAVFALDRALTINAFLAPEYGPLREEARRLRAP